MVGMAARLMICRDVQMIPDNGVLSPIFVVEGGSGIRRGGLVGDSGKLFVVA